MDWNRKYEWREATRRRVDAQINMEEGRRDFDRLCEEYNKAVDEERTAEKNCVEGVPYPEPVVAPKVEPLLDGNPVPVPELEVPF